MNVFVLNTKEDILKETQQFWGTIDSHSIIFPAMEVNGAPELLFPSEYLPLCSADALYYIKAEHNINLMFSEMLFKHRMHQYISD